MSLHSELFNLDCVDRVMSAIDDAPVEELSVLAHDIRQRATKIRGNYPPVLEGQYDERLKFIRANLQLSPAEFRRRTALVFLETNEFVWAVNRYFSKLQSIRELTPFERSLGAELLQLLSSMRLKLTKERT